MTLTTIDAYAILSRFLSLDVRDTAPVFDQFGPLRGPGTLEASIPGDPLYRYLFIPGTTPRRPDRVLLVAHADTIWDRWDLEWDPSSLRFAEGVFRRTGAPYGLGADDRAGCAMLWALQGLGHSLLVLAGEESGGTTAEWIAERGDPHRLADVIATHQFAVEFDRQGATDIKFYYVASDEFEEYAKAATGYSMPDRGSFTDISTLCTEICGANLSVGYYDEHSPRERLVLEDWENTLQVTRQWLSQPGLPRFER
jgi:hypothetical protein